ncbi:MAG: arginine deiminase family protein [bacterium]
MIYNINSEYGELQVVILGNPEKFTEGEQINEAMRKYYGTDNAPSRSELLTEYERIKEILMDCKVEVYFPKPTDNVPQQLAPRDIGFVIGNKFFISNMKWRSRKHEIDQIKYLLANFNGEVIQTPDNVYLEGGNIVIDEKTVYVGIGLRTSKNAVQFLKNMLGNKYVIVTIFLNHQEEIIHLDAVFNILAGKIAIVYKEGIMGTLPKKYKYIEIDKTEKDLGACNVLSLNSRDIIIRNKLDRIENLLRNSGFTMHVVKWDEIKKTGTVGPRCATLPLMRN